jgi:two-component system, NarL family, sensor kinase
MLPSQVVLLLFAGTFLFMLLGFVITFLIFRHNNKLNLLNLQKNQLISESRARHIRENERMMNQISKELHDNIGQSASLIRASLHKATRMANDVELTKLIAGTAELTEQIMRDAKNISHSLNQNFIKARNLHLLLEQDLEHIRNFSNISYEFDIVGSTKRLMPESKLIVYRIAQEAFHNILKHSNASHICLLVEYGMNSFKMRIQDNGVGLPAEVMHARDGIGLTNMRERAEYLNGEIIIDSNPGRGCTVNLIVHNFEFNSDAD